jgi:hypothetical protein
MRVAHSHDLALILEDQYVSNPLARAEIAILLLENGEKVDDLGLRKFRERQVMAGSEAHHA